MARWLAVSICSQKTLSQDFFALSNLPKECRRYTYMVSSMSCCWNKHQYQSINVCVVDRERRSFGGWFCPSLCCQSFEFPLMLWHRSIYPQMCSFEDLIKHGVNGKEGQGLSWCSGVVPGVSSGWFLCHCGYRMVKELFTVYYFVKEPFTVLLQWTHQSAHAAGSCIPLAPPLIILTSVVPVDSG